MRIRKIHAVFFSATGNTALVTSRLASYLGSGLYAPVEKEDLTAPQKRVKRRNCEEGELVVFGVPTYAGRVPNKILPFLESGFDGNGALAIPLVTFGNRSCGSALIELRNLMEADGFHTIAAASVVCRHAFAQIAANRPEKEDFRLLKNLARELTEIIGKSENAQSLPRVRIGEENEVQPYYIPLGLDGQPVKFLKAKPKTDRKKCSGCGMCAQLCPMGSISFEDTRQVPGICIKCQACVVSCPQHAKYFDDPAFLSHKAYLEKNYRRAAKTEVYCIE